MVVLLLLIDVADAVTYNYSCSSKNIKLHSAMCKAFHVLCLLRHVRGILFTVVCFEVYVHVCAVVVLRFYVFVSMCRIYVVCFMYFVLASIHLMCSSCYDVASKLFSCLAVVLVLTLCALNVCCSIVHVMEVEVTEVV